ncbi:DUF4328 domain-containing protein [Streptomyces sp. NPDC002516]
MTMPSSPQQSAAPLPPHPSPHGAVSLRSPVLLGRIAAALLGLVIAADLLAVWADYTLYDVTSGIGSALAGGESLASLTRRADRADSLNATAGYIQAATLVAAAVGYLVWLFRVRVNAEFFNPFGHTYSRAWVGWGWFVPFVNLARPRQIVAEIWDASRPEGTRARHGLVNTWWTFWLVGLLADRIAFSASRKAETAEAIRDAAFQGLLTDAFDILSAALAIAVVLRLTGMQDRKAHEGPGTVLG